MPIVTVKFSKGRSLDAKRKIAAEITRTLVEHASVKPEWVSVIFEEVERDCWATGGELHSDKFGSGFGTHGSRE